MEFYLLPLLFPIVCESLKFPDINGFRNKISCLGEYCGSDPSRVSNFVLKLDCTKSKPCVKVNWDNSPQFDLSQINRYRLRYRIVAPESLRNNYSTHELTETSYTMDTHHKPAYGVTYEFRVAKYYKGKYDQDSVKNISIPESVPSDSPKKLTQRRIDSKSTLVSWVAPNPIYHNGIIIFYEVRYYAVSHEEPTERIINVTKTNIILSNLSFSEYKIFVRAYNKVGPGIWSDPLYYYGTNVLDLPVPINVKAYRESGTELEIKWSLPEVSELIKGFIVFYSPIGKQYTDWQKHSSTGADLKTNIRGLQPFRKYKVKVAAVNSRGLNGNFSNIVEERTMTVPSLNFRTVRDLRCYAVDSKILALEWLAPKITSDLIKFEVLYSAEATYISSMNLKTTEFINKLRKFINFEVDVQRYSMKLEDLQANAFYTVAVRSSYHNDGQSDSFQSLLETSCRTDPTMPDFLATPIATSVLMGQNLVKIGLIRCSERNGSLSNYSIIVAPFRTTLSMDIAPLKEPDKYTLIELSLNAKTKDHSGPYIALFTNINSLFTKEGMNYTEVILGNEFVANKGIIHSVNKRLELEVFYKVFVRVCLDEISGNVLCKSSDWSEPFNIKEMIKAKRNVTGFVDIAKNVTKKTGILSFTILLIVVLLSGVFLAVACIIVGCVIKRQKWTKRLISLGNSPSSNNRDSARTSMKLKTSQTNGVRASDKCLLHADTEMVNNHLNTYSAAPDLVTAESVLMCQDGFKLSPIIVNGSLRNPFVNHKSDSRQTIKDAPEKAPTPVSELYQYISDLKANESALLQSEFETLNSNLDDRFSWQRSNIDSNKNKNRYANVVAYDHTSVLLQPVDDVIGSDYINANYIDGYQKQNAYIATQGPLPDTTDDFWRMVWEQNSRAVVMMTRLEERSGVKCHQYWPNRGFICYGQMIVCHIDSFNFAYYTIRLFELRHSKYQEKREIQHFQFTAWPDHGVPKLSTPLLMLIRRFRAMTRIESGAPVVHCSAGVGRTGAFIVIDSQLERIKHEKTTDLFNYVSKIRSQRNYMVQTQAQYLFILETLLEAVEDGNTEVSACNIYSHISKLSQVGISGSNELSGFELEFSKLNSLASNRDRHGMMLADFVKAAGNQPVNLTKNKVRNIIPYDWNRVILPAIRGIDGSDYINSSYIDGYRDRRAYIAAQSPLPSSVEDFWRMIWDQHSGVIVVLNQTQEEKCHVYWPVHKSIRYQFFVVDPVVEYNMPNYILREFKVTDARDGEFRTLRQFQFTQWPSHGCPKESDSILDFIRQVHKTKEQFGHMEPMIVHCSTGSGRTGVFIALSIVIDRLQQESTVDMYQTVKLLHKQRLGLVQTEEQYEFCYKSVVAYLSYYEKNDKSSAY